MSVETDLDKLGRRILSLIRRLMANRNKNATGQTVDSLRFATEVDTNFVYTLDVFGSIVFRYINDGRKPGKFPPKGVLIPWMQARGIPRGAEYPIRRKIARDGIAPYPIIDLTVKQVDQRLLGQVGTELQQRVGQTISNALKKGFDFPVIQL